jgi:hypothetical protein
VKHGLGDELTLVGPVVAAGLRAGWDIEIWTHHPVLYSHRATSVHGWADVGVEVDFCPPASDVGLCYHSYVQRLPLAFDRSPRVLPACQKRGWLLLDGDGRSLNREFDNGYDYSRWVIAELGLDWPSPPWEFLHVRDAGYVLVNPWGFGEVEKGLPPGSAWLAVESLARRNPWLHWKVARLESTPAWPEVRARPGNLSIDVFDYGASGLLGQYLSARAIITSEGGGYHLAVAAGIPALLVTSCEWHEQVKHALPPLPRDTALFSWRELDLVALVSRISDWTAGLSTTAVRHE